MRYNYKNTKEVKERMIDYNDVEDYLDWTKQKAALKFNSGSKNFPIVYNCVYWAFMGCNVGSEEGKHRPVLVIRTYKNSPICTVLPMTTQRLNDGYWYHIDLEKQNSTVLCEQMRIIDIARIDKPFRVGGKIVSITKKDWKAIDKQVKWLYSMKNKPQQ